LIESGSRRRGSNVSQSHRWLATIIEIMNLFGITVWTEVVYSALPDWMIYRKLGYLWGPTAIRVKIKCQKNIWNYVYNYDYYRIFPCMITDIDKTRLLSSDMMWSYCPPFWVGQMPKSPQNLNSCLKYLKCNFFRHWYSFLSQ